MGELKATLNLPKTDFSMKANLPQNEPKMLARWQEMKIYELVRQARLGSPSYLLHDGPPYANGPIHLGTAFNKTLKDFTVKSKTMDGFDAPYVPGWDCHGLPIEIKVDESLGRKKLDMHPMQVRAECRKYADKFLDLQRGQFKRIGVFGDWERPYSTMNPQYESVVVRTLYDFLEKGALYKGLKPVYWCIHDKTALAEAEVEYENHTSPSIWVKYRITSDPSSLDPALAGKQVSTIIWTTTPWTLPASMAVAFHPDLEYVALEHGADVYIVAAALAEQTKANCHLDDAKVIARFSGRTLEFTTFSHPFLERQILGVLADYVTTDQGTGAVHTAPSHGADDFYTGVKYKLDQTCEVDEAGRIRHGLPEYDGLRVFDANPKIVELLKSRGVLLGYGQIEHSYPHCWRCHHPVIFRATEQWFISMEAEMGGGTLRQRALEEIKTVKWDPAWGEERIANMVSGRPDWCISRQRVWGVPIAVFFCECGQLLNDAAANHAVVELFASRGSDAWYTTDPKDILPPGVKCAQCGATSFRKEMDIIDVWFESGVSSLAVLPAKQWPADMYLEGGDQHRGWFQSSLLCSIGARNHIPYRTCVTPGWTLDPQGRAMSKSLGNVVDPVDIANRLGAEIVRLWVASVDFREDVRASEELMQRIADQYRKVRNTFRFPLGNLFDFDPARDALAFADLMPLDRYMLLRTAEMADEVVKHYREFAFHKAYYAMHDFCVVALSATYFDVLKDRLYTFAPNSRPRRSAQTAIWRIAEALVRLFAPVMSFTAEEIWGFLPRTEGRELSVHLARFPQAAQLTAEAADPAEAARLRSDFETLLAVREEALKALEVERKNKTIGTALEAVVTLTAPEPTHGVLEKHGDTLRELLITSGVNVERAEGDSATSVTVRVSRAPGQKCERCWNYSTHVGENREYPTVCERCSAALAEIAAAAQGRT